MGLLGGWWGVTVVGVVALFLAREVFKYMRGEVELTARQKVVRVLGGAMLMTVLVMILYAPVVFAEQEGQSPREQAILQLGYGGIALALSVLTLLMAVMDLGEVSRQFTNARKNIRTGALTQEDIDRLIAAERKDHPDEIGRDRGNPGNGGDHPDGHGR